MHPQARNLRAALSHAAERVKPLLPLVHGESSDSNAWTKVMPRRKAAGHPRDQAVGLAL